METNNQAVLNVVHLANAITNYRNAILVQLGLTAAQSDVLRYILKQDGNITAGSLMDYLHLSQPTVAGIVKRLCEKGLITKTTDCRDSRRVLLSLTSRGLELRDSLQSMAAHTEQVLFLGMTSEEQELFRHLLARSLDNMRTMSSEARGGDSHG